MPEREVRSMGLVLSGIVVPLYSAVSALSLTVVLELVREAAAIPDTGDNQDQSQETDEPSPPECCRPEIHGNLLIFGTLF